MVWLGLEDTQNTTGCQTTVKAPNFPPRKCIRDFPTTGYFPTPQGKTFENHPKQKPQTKDFRIQQTLPPTKHRKHLKKQHLFRQERTTNSGSRTDQPKRDSAKGTETNQGQTRSGIRVRGHKGTRRFKKDGKQTDSVDSIDLTRWTQLTS